MKPMNNIPTQEEFERASRIMKEKSRMLDVVRDAVRREFSERCPLHEFFILDQRDVDFRAYIFFKTETDLVASEKSGIREKLVDFIFSELERVGRGKRETTRVAFEFDSDENVRTKFEGDYFLRLR
jgi:hypothetical protein